MAVNESEEVNVVVIVGAVTVFVTAGAAGSVVVLIVVETDVVETVIVCAG